MTDLQSWLSRVKELAGREDTEIIPVSTDLILALGECAQALKIANDDLGNRKADLRVTHGIAQRALSRLNSILAKTEK